MNESKFIETKSFLEILWNRRKAKREREIIYDYFRPTSQSRVSLLLRFTSQIVVGYLAAREL